MTRAPSPVSAAQPDQREEAVIGRIRDALRDMQFGTIALTVHNARVVQLDVTEKRRFEA
jgi:hypothetical protein